MNSIVFKKIIFKSLYVYFKVFVLFLGLNLGLHLLLPELPSKVIGEVLRSPTITESTEYKAMLSSKVPVEKFLSATEEERLAEMKSSVDLILFSVKDTKLENNYKSKAGLFMDKYSDYLHSAYYVLNIFGSLIVLIVVVLYSTLSVFASIKEEINDVKS